jgi:predicted metal-binding protein
MNLTPEKRQSLDAIIKAKGYSNFKWIDPQKIIVSQWVRTKCQYGCGEFGRGGACPPNTPSVAECERFFGEYSDAVILHFEGTMDKPEDRHAWSRKINANGDRQTCNEPRMARPAPEAMAVDVYSTVRQFGFPINVRSAYDQKMDRYAFLMVH